MGDSGEAESQGERTRESWKQTGSRKVITEGWEGPEKKSRRETQARERRRAAEGVRAKQAGARATQAGTLWRENQTAVTQTERRGWFHVEVEQMHGLFKSQGLSRTPASSDAEGPGSSAGGGGTGQWGPPRMGLVEGLGWGASMTRVPGWRRKEPPGKGLHWAGRGDGGTRRTGRRRELWEEEKWVPAFSGATEYFTESGLILKVRQCSLHLGQELTHPVAV